MKIAILGAGPAGLFAAHAVTMAGWEPRIYSVGGKSRLYGAQYLHVPIPGLTLVDEPALIDYQLQGTVDGYRSKVYDLNQHIVVSPEVLAGPGWGWDIRATYELAWRRYSKLIDPQVIGVGWVNSAIHEFDLIISTIHAPHICHNDNHYFNSRRVWAIGDAPDLDVWCPVEVANNTVVCNGMESPAWYRASNIFGYRTAEWPYDTRSRDLPLRAKLIKKPTGTNCDCWGDKVLRLGRFGTWHKGSLSHTAFYRTEEYLNERETNGRG